MKWFLVSNAEHRRREKKIKSVLTGKAGVYAVFENGELIYIGRSKNLATRTTLSGHKTEWGAKDRRHIYWKVRFDRFEDENVLLERSLIVRLAPKENVFGKRSWGEFIKRCWAQAHP